jgi:hypothetical protein
MQVQLLYYINSIKSKQNIESHSLCLQNVLEDNMNYLISNYLKFTATDERGNQNTEVTRSFPLLSNVLETHAGLLLGITIAFKLH